MKTYNEIVKDIAAAREKARKMRECAEVELSAHNLKASGGYYEKANNLEIAIKIMQDNAVCAFAAENVNTIADIMKKFDGKPYGEKTAEKMRNMAKSAGLGFYLSRRYSIATVSFYPLDENGYTVHGVEVELDGYNNEYLTDNNKIAAFDPQPIIDRYTAKYCDNPGEKVLEIILAVKDYENAKKALENTAKALNDLLPSGHCSADYFVKTFYL